MAREAYAAFAHPAVTPLQQIGANTFVLELFHGPTLAFKDVAMRMLARLMDHILAKRGQRATIVGATSGDTGGAAIEAFRTSQRVDVVILFPDGRVSDVQRRMMTTPTEPNVHAVAIDGDFDDCQALVKGMFNHHAFRDRVALSGVNSINWGRILAQITYYFVAAAALGAPHRKVSFVVPTGNFGDIFAGYAAKRMGLPVERLVVATNSNDILARTHATGAYEMQGVSGHHLAVDGHPDLLQFRALSLRGLEPGFRARPQPDGRVSPRAGSFHARPKAQIAVRCASEFGAARAGEDEIAATIRRVKAESGYLMDTHTACGEIARKKTLAEDAHAGRAPGDGPPRQVPGGDGGDHRRAATPCRRPSTAC